MHSCNSCNLNLYAHFEIHFQIKLNLIINFVYTIISQNLIKFWSDLTYTVCTWQTQTTNSDKNWAIKYLLISVKTKCIFWSGYILENKSLWRIPISRGYCKHQPFFCYITFKWFSSNYFTINTQIKLIYVVWFYWAMHCLPKLG